MRIDRLDLIAYGGFTDRVLDLSAGPRRFHILFGPNESGKSTSLRAITGLLFGMEARTTDDFIHRKRELRVGAKLITQETEFECIRRRGNKNTLLKANGSDPADDKVLDQMLAGVDRETFLSQFGLTHTALVEGGRSITEGSGDLGEILFAAGAGVSRLNAVKRSLEEQWKQIFLPSGSKPQLNDRLSELKTLRAELREAQLPPSDFQRRRKALEEAEEETRRRDADVRSRQQRIAVWSSYRDALPLIARRNELQKELEPLTAVPLLDPDFIHRRREADLARQAASDRIEQLRQRQKQLDQRLEQLPDDKAIGSLASTINSLYEHLGAIRNARRELPNLENEHGELSRAIDDTLRELERAPETDLESLRISDRVRRQIAQLADAYPPLRQRLDAAEAQWETLNDEAQEAEAALEQLEKPGKCDDLDAVLRRVGKPEHLLQRLDEASDGVARLQQRAEAKRRRLKGFDGSLEEAVALKPPLAASVRRCADALQSARGELERLREKRREQEEYRGHLERDLDAVQNSEAVPSERELQDVRTQRDDDVEALASDLAENRPQDAAAKLPGLRAHIRTADATADRLRHDAERVAKRAETEANLASTDRQLEILAQQETETADRYQEAVTQWNALWQEAGVEAGTPEEMKEWCEEHRQLLEIFEDLHSARTVRQTATESVERAVAELLQISGPERRTQSASLAGSHATFAPSASDDRQASLFGDPQDELIEYGPRDLMELCELAQRQLDQFRSAEQRYAEALNEKQRIAKAIPAAKRNLRQLQNEMERWQTEWQEVTQMIDVSAESKPDEVQRRVSRLDGLFTQARQREKLEKKIEQVQTELESFQREAQEAAARAGLNDSSHDASQVVERLMEELQKHRQHEEQRRSLGEQSAQVRDDIDAAKQTVELRSGELQRLCQEAGCDAIEQLPEVESRSAQRAELQAKLQSVDDQLRLLAADRDFQKFLAEAEEQEAESLAARIAEETRALESEQATLNELRETVGMLRRDVRAMDGSDRAAALQQQIQDLLVKIRRDAERYATLRVANVALHTAIERYREKNQGPVLKRAEQIFSQLTHGVYESLRAEFDEKDRPVLIGSRDGRAVPVQRMSDGTADALYLSLRLASLETHLQERAPIPLIVDDILIQFDDRRASAALKILAEFSEKTQIIFFTHHQHLVELAKQTLAPTDFHVHHLDRTEPAA